MSTIIENANELFSQVAGIFALVIGVRLAGSVLLLIVRNIWVKEQKA